MIRRAFVDKSPSPLTLDLALYGQGESPSPFAVLRCKLICIMHAVAGYREITVAEQSMEMMMAMMTMMTALMMMMMAAPPRAVRWGRSESA